jgi:hypothetical protein
MSVAVFVTDQSKYTENFERKNKIERKKDERPRVQKCPSAAIA